MASYGVHFQLNHFNISGSWVTDEEKQTACESNGGKFTGLKFKAVK